MMALLPSPADRAKPGSGRCIACGRRLLDPVSRRRGYGPVCARSMVPRGGKELFGRKVGGFIAEVATGVIVVVDQERGRTAAADGWALIQQLRGEGFNLGLPVLYRDTTGLWSQLRMPDRGRVENIPLAALEYGDARLELWRLLQGAR